MAAFYNQATLSYQNSVVSSNIVTGEILEVLGLSKLAVDDSYQPGDTLTYVVSIANTGEAAYSGLTLTDDLGAYTLPGGATVTPLEYVDGSLQLFADGVLQPGPQVTATDPLTVTGLTVQDNGSAMVLYQVTVNEYAPLGETGTVVNTATLSGGRLVEPITATAVVGAETNPILSISKALSPVAVNENGQVTYTLVMHNRGSTEASGDVILRDTFDPVLSGITVTYNGALWTLGQQYSYDETTGLFESVAGEITIPAATAVQDPDTGVWSVVPGAATVVVTGTI